MFFARARRFTKTFLFRLMVLNAGVVVLTAAVTLFGMQVGVRRALLHEIDEFLLEDAAEVSRSLAANLEGVAVAPLAGGKGSMTDRGPGRFVTILADDGEVAWASEHQPESLPSLPFEELGPIHVGGYRLVQRLAREGQGARGDDQGHALLVRVGIPTQVLDEDTARVDGFAARMAAVLLLVAPGLGYWLARGATHALRDLTSRTSRLRPTQLDERLPLHGAGDELDHLATTINGLLDRIASYVNRREDFLADAAHELRTPVAAIRSTAEVALGGIRSKEEYETVLGDVINECSMLEHLVNQLLLLAESSTDRLRIHGERVALDEIVHQAAEMFGAVAESLGVRLAVSAAEVVVEGNSHHLRQVLNNLLDNALKYTPAGGRIDVQLTADQTAGWVVLTVRDTGCGIAETDLPRIFERFYRCDHARSHATRGTGLGLSICQSVVEAHGGRIEVTSKSGEGTVFTLRFPTVMT